MSVSPSGHERKVGESNPVQPSRGNWLAPSFLSQFGYLPFISVEPPGIEPGFPPRQGGVFPLDHGPVLLSGPDGSRTHRHEALDLAALPICVPGRGSLRELHPAVQAYEARLGLRPVRELQAPASSRAHRPDQRCASVPTAS
jgi:hypothetical protein